ncbi:MAG: hypothetical protein V3T65_08395 [Acidobacteriota bacterium]
MPPPRFPSRLNQGAALLRIQQLNYLGKVLAFQLLQFCWVGLFTLSAQLTPLLVVFAEFGL